MSGDSCEMVPNIWGNSHGTVDGLQVDVRLKSPLFCLEAWWAGGGGWGDGNLDFHGTLRCDHQLPNSKSFVLCRAKDSLIMCITLSVRASSTLLQSPASVLSLVSNNKQIHQGHQKYTTLVAIHLRVSLVKSSQITTAAASTPFQSRTYPSPTPP